MFPLLDLDDDAIAAALGFSDPPSLCSATMTCRRLRRLADAAWIDLDKCIGIDKREGGTNPRERVLSSYVVHERGEWLKKITAETEATRNDACLENLASADLQHQDHLLCLRIGYADRSVWPDWYLQNRDDRLTKWFTLEVTNEQALRFANNTSIFLPIKREQLKDTHDFEQIINKYTSCETQFQQLVRRTRSDAPYSRDEARGDMDFLFSKASITVVAVNRKTLKPSIFFKKENRNETRDPSIKSFQIRK